MKQQIVLASSSRYRKQLLKKLNIEFTSFAPHINETPKPNEPPIDLALRLAVEKAHATQHKFSNHLIIGSDQVASINTHIFGKPGNHEQTIQQLKNQSGQSVHFHTSICVLNTSTGQYHTDTDLTTVQFRALTEKQIINYINKEPAYNCAGGFKSEGLGIALFEKIDTKDPNALIGLPLIKLINLLEHFGHPVI